MPDGDLVAGGRFSMIGGIPANRIARWNGVGWAALGSGMDGEVHAISPLPDGKIAAAGFFTSAGGNIVNRIAIWNGFSWQSLGSGMNALSTIRALAVLPGNRLSRPATSRPRVELLPTVSRSGTMTRGRRWGQEWMQAFSPSRCFPAEI